MTLRSLLAAAALSGLLLAAASGPAQARVRNCSPQPGVTLTAKGVGCATAKRAIRLALARPGCTPTPAQRDNYEGCYGTTRVAGWTCKGLFPGEGYDLVCRRSGGRRVHGSGGG